VAPLEPRQSILRPHLDFREVLFKQSSETREILGGITAFMLKFVAKCFGF
jgi:hypothetical protein